MESLQSHLDTITLQQAARKLFEQAFAALGHRCALCMKGLKAYEVARICEVKFFGRFNDQRTSKVQAAHNQVFKAAPNCSIFLLALSLDKR